MYLDSYNFAQLAALGALTVSAVSTVALAALWTAWGTRFYWYVRAMTLVALVGPLAWLAAASPCCAFAVQALVMVAVLAAVRGFRNWRGSSNASWRFRIADGLAVIVYLSLVLAQIVAWRGWFPQSAATALRMGVGFALIGLIGVWLAVRPARVSGYVSRAIVVLAAAAVTIFLIDFAPSYLRPTYGVTHYWQYVTSLTWITPLVVAVIAAPWLMSGESTRAKRWSRRLGVASALIVMVALGSGYAALLPPREEFQAPRPEPNGYDFVEHALIGFDRELSVQPWQASDAQLEAFLAETASVRAAAREGLKLPSVVHFAAMPEDYQRRYRLLQAWQTELVAASRRGDSAGIVDATTAMLGLCRQDWNGGIELTIVACSTKFQAALTDLRQTPQWPDDPGLQPLLPVMLQWETGLESPEVIKRRTAPWIRWGDWKYRLRARIGDDSSSSILQLLVPHLQADLRLSAVELALARFRALHGDYPDSLEQLVPEILPTVPADPFAPSRPICYRRQAKGYVMYCVGWNGVDDGGKPGNDHFLP